MGKPKKQASGQAGAESTDSEPRDGDVSEPEPKLRPVPAEEPSTPARWFSWLQETIQTERQATLLIVALGALLFVPYLGTLGLWDPWETHYGEVARAMIARDDYVYPYWESAYFFSKPAFPLWLMALGMVVTGAESGAPGDPLGAWAEWGIRFPFVVIAIAAMVAVYWIGKQLKNRTTGLIAAFVLASCPQFIFIGKQAMTDMPLVGLMTIGLAFFMAAVFDTEEDAAASSKIKIITASGLGLALFSQLVLIGRELSGVALLPILGCAVFGLGVVGYVFMAGTRRDCYLIAFYILTGLAALSKGLAVLAVVGPLVIIYMVFALDFDILKRSKFYLWGFVFLLVAGPWYGALSLFKGRDDEGLTFNQRFWFHDNFNRVGAGVHGDRAGLGYFVEQLAYGMFPWAAAVPFAIGRAMKSVQDEKEVMRSRALLFVLIWAIWVYAFFTMSQTKFHHYIFPAVPALAILVAVWFGWLAERPDRRVKRVMAAVLLLLLVVIGRDLLNQPKHLVNLFTYKYDRDFPREMVPRLYMGIIFGLGAAAMIGNYIVKKKGGVLLSFALMAALFGTWISHHHFNMLSPHWSQAHLFKTFYAEQRPGEPIYAYQLNWRGETFYSRNRILQVKEAGANQRIRRLVDQPGREFIVTEQSRFHTLRNTLSPDKRDKLQILDRSSNKFYLCVVEE